MTYRSAARGFTLVELSIVLVIIGLIIGGVLAAQNVIQNARINNAISGLQSFQSVVQTYNQNYGALPGDDNQATSRFGTRSHGNGDGNGAIGGNTLAVSFNINAAASATTAENQLFWNHLRAAELIKGSGVVLPANPFNGIYGVQNGAFTDTTGFALGTMVLCMDRVPGTAAQAIDTRLDDGEPNAGTLRAGASVDGAMATPPYSNTQTYVLCTTL